MSDTQRKILVTSALPYANGPIHLGHLVEYIQTDIWVRFQKQRGHQCTYVCADDAHGTPIMLKADQMGINPQALIDQVSQEHQRDFAGFMVGFDNYTQHIQMRTVSSPLSFIPVCGIKAILRVKQLPKPMILKKRCFYLIAL